ncbi:TPA: hypothetical protein WD517_001873 [Neisseria meningitidis]
MSAANVIFSCSYWRIFKKSDYCVLCFYQFRHGEPHKLAEQENFSKLYQVLDYIDLIGLNFPVIITTDVCGFSS